MPARPPFSPTALHSRRQILASASSCFPAVPAVAALQNPVAAVAAMGAAPARTAAQARSVILIFNCGAPSHIDLWDPKPEAPAEIRGPFQPIQTSVPGIEVSELLPGLARQMHRLSIIRTVHHSHGGHNSGMHWSTVGRPYRIDSTLINPGPADTPSFGTLVGWLAQQDGYTAGVPPYVITPFPHCDSTKYLTPGQFGGCLGSRFDPFVLNADPNARNFHVPGLRLDESMDSNRLTSRLDLLKHLERQGNAVTAATHAAADIENFRSKALGMISAGTASEVFDLSREPNSLRDRYGRHSWGQSHLLARRLIEAGTRVVTLSWAPDANATWDTHGNNFNKLRDTLLPQFDQAAGSLIRELDERGMLERTLVAILGDFGRTPRVNANAGRDHWNSCYSILLAGGGLKQGLVHGASDRIGAVPAKNPTSPADIVSTLYHLLGVDPRMNIHDLLDRPHLLVPGGRIMNELLV